MRVVPSGKTRSSMVAFPITIRSRGRGGVLFIARCRSLVGCAGTARIRYTKDDAGVHAHEEESMTVTPPIRPDYERFTVYERALAVSQGRAEAIVAQAQLPAQRLLADPAAHVGPDGLLPVRPRVVPVDSARYGYLLPAWPEPDKRPVPLFVVPNYGLMSYLWRLGIGEPPGEQAQVEERFLSGERIWVGLANDVLQPFVPAPPAGSYR